MPRPEKNHGAGPMMFYTSEVTRRRKLGLAFVAFVVLAAASAARLRYVPEPEYKGVKFGYFLTNHMDERVIEALAALGPRAVPYLVNEMKPNPGYELMFKIAPRLPAAVQKLTPNERQYQNRRVVAASLLFRLDTEAIDVLPHALRAVEEKDPVILPACVNIVGWFGPGTPYETRAVNALVAAAEVPGVARGAVNWLVRLKTNHPQVIPVLIRQMYEPGAGETCMKGLVRFGTNALPALRVAAEAEKKGHIRLAEMTIEKIEQQARAASPTPTNSTKLTNHEHPDRFYPLPDPARLMR